MSRRVGITGMGVIAPGGVGVKAFWDMMTAGRTATRRISTFDASRFRSQVAAECDFHPSQHGLTADDVRRMDRATQMAVACAREAMTDSALDLSEPDPARTGVSVGSAVGCTMGL